MSPFPYFTSLVERATLRMPVLERRPRSLFEPAMFGPAARMPVPRVPVAAAREGRGTLAEEDAAAGSERATSRTGAARLDGSEPAPADHNGQTAAVSVSGRGHRSGGEERRLLSDRKQYDALDPAVLRERAPAATLAALNSARRLPRDGGLRTSQGPLVHPMEEPSAQRADRGGDRDGGAQVAPRVQRTSASSSSMLVTPGTNSLTAKSAAAARVAAAGGSGAEPIASLLRTESRLPGPSSSIVRSHTRPGAPRSNHVAAPPPAPVQITIGRIEVRASSPAVADRPPTRRSPPGPKMSLDDYLHGRRGGV